MYIAIFRSKDSFKKFVEVDMSNNPNELTKKVNVLNSINSAWQNYILITNRNIFTNVKTYLSKISTQYYAPLKKGYL